MDVVVNEFNQPWGEPERDGKLWTTVGHGLTAKSVRNDALWAAKKADREAILPLAHQYRIDAAADGWTVTALYPNEPVESAAKLERDGWVMHLLARPSPADDESLPSSSVTIWAPDKAQIRPPPTYSFDAMVAATRVCLVCKAADVDTKLLAFASRVCAACEPEYRRTAMAPGWCS